MSFFPFFIQLDKKKAKIISSSLCGLDLLASLLQSYESRMGLEASEEAHKNAPEALDTRPHRLERIARTATWPIHH